MSGRKIFSAPGLTASSIVHEKIAGRIARPRMIATIISRAAQFGIIA
jgi:hypothetical protein